MLVTGPEDQRQTLFFFAFLPLDKREKKKEKKNTDAFMPFFFPSPFAFFMWMFSVLWS